MTQQSEQERTEQPSEKRLREARENGNVPRSKEATTAAVVGVAVIVLVATGTWVAELAVQMMRHAFTFSREALTRPGFLTDAVFDSLGRGLVMMSPVLISCVLAVVLAHLAISGWHPTSKSLTPDPSRLNPQQGLKRMFSMQSTLEVVKGILKFILIGGVAYYAIRHDFPMLLNLSSEPARQGIAHGFALVLKMLVWLILPLFVLALMDGPYQVWYWYRQLRMTREELRQEMKESEGNPETKGRIRRLQQEMAKKRMMAAVPGADVIVVNPTHYAVAIKYETGKMRAPRVVAKGVDLIAQVIRETAEKHKIPILSAPPLARALYRLTEIDQEIPTKLYAAVAQVLTYVYQLRNWQSQGGYYPSKPEIKVDEAGGE